VVAQMLGALFGALTLRLLLGDIALLGATVPSGSSLQSFGLEVLLTAVLMFVIISVATDTRAVGTPAALAIGFTVALDAMWGGPISGASMNPARSFGPSLIAGVWENQWIYWLAPILGAMIGATLYQWLREPQKKLQETL
jgi:aquaporin NIP